MSAEGLPDEHDGDFDGIAGVEALDEHLDTVAGRDMLPWWFDGVTASSAPSLLMMRLMGEHAEVMRAYDSDPEGRHKLSHINRKLGVFSELHKQHRSMMALGIDPLTAVGCTLDTICNTMKAGDPPFNGYELAEWEPYVWEVARSYKDLYV